MKRLKKRYVTLILLVLVLVAWATFFAYFEPEDIVESIGVRNSYLIAFLVAVFGGLSAVTGTSFFLTIATFASSGSNPLLLGLFGGAGIFISDTIFFFVAKYGVKTLEASSHQFSHWIKAKFEKLPNWEVLLFVYLYLGFTPLPNDLLMIALALYGMSFARLAPVLAAGSVTVVTLTAYLGLNFLGGFIDLL